MSKPTVIVKNEKISVVSRGIQGPQGPAGTAGRGANEIWIGSGPDCDYATISEAMDSILDAGAENPYILKLKRGANRAPNVWDTFVWKPYVYAEVEFESDYGYLELYGIDFTALPDTSWSPLSRKFNGVIDLGGYPDLTVADMNALVALTVENDEIAAPGALVRVRDRGEYDGHADPLAALYRLSTTDPSEINDWVRVDPLGSTGPIFYVPSGSGVALMGSRMRWSQIVGNHLDSVINDFGGGEADVNGAVFDLGYFSGNNNDLNIYSARFEGTGFAEYLKETYWGFCTFRSIFTEQSGAIPCSLDRAEFWHCMFDSVRFSDTSFTNAVFTECVFRDLTLENVDFTNATMPAKYATKAEFLAVCYSVDNVTWIDGNPL